MYVYGHGGNAAFEDGNKNIIDLSANINPLGMPASVKDAIINEIANCNRYPDNSCVRLREKIAEYENIGAGRIFCGNGASDIIFRLPRALGAKKVVVASPAFSDYERSAAAAGVAVIRHKLDEGCGFSLTGGILDLVRKEKPDLVFVCNPNNPTGVLAEAGFIGDLAECCRSVGAWVAVDECFLDFCEKAGENTCKLLLERYPNLIMIKAFTKIFALPGIRLGYAICADQKIIDRLCYHGADWPVSNLAQAAGVAALDGADEFVRQTVDYVATERVKLENCLTGLGYKVYDSKANFIFIKNPYPFSLSGELDARGIRIRSCANFHGLDDSYYRIAISAKENNDKVLAIIAEITNIWK